MLTRADCLARGMSEAEIRAQLAAGRWQALNERVLCRHNGPLTRDEQWSAAVLSAQPPTGLCGLTGSASWGLKGFEVGDVHVVVRRGAKVLPVTGVSVVVHESRRFSAADVVAGRLPRTSIERSVIDAAAWSADAVLACRITIAAVQQRLTSAGRLRSALEEAGSVRHCRRLRALLVDVEGGAEALSEVAFLRWCRRHGLPAPRTQVRKDFRGRRRYLDAEFTASDGRTVWVEIDGGIHLDLSVRWQDMAKDNEAAIAGQRVLRFTSAAIYLDDPVALEQLRRMLGLNLAGGSRVVRPERRHSDARV